MSQYGPLLMFFAFFATVVGSFIVAERRHRQRFAHQFIVSEGCDYPNNHHVLGVGYYHAPARQWHVHPWNEYREGQGYFWSGAWHVEPDQRIVTASRPEPAEIARVNRAWREADPDNMKSFWAEVESFGFGTAVRRRERS